MKTIRLALLLLAGSAAAVSAALSVPSWAREVRLLMPDGESVLAELALTQDQHARGLMYRTVLPAGRGMLFVFQGQGRRQFWMKNTLIDLDMVFLDGGLKVLQVFHRVPRSSPDTPEAEVARVSGEAELVLELPAGYARARGLRPGSRLKVSSFLRSGSAKESGGQAGPPRR